MNDLNFTKRQTTLIATALSLLALTVVLAIAGFGLTVVSRFVSKHSSVLLPPILAIICAQIVQPEFDKLRRFFMRFTRKKGLATAAAIIILYAAFFVPAGIFLWFFGKLVLNESANLINDLPKLAKWVKTALETNLPQVWIFVENHKLAPVIDKIDPAEWFDLGALASKLGDYAISFGVYLRKFFGTFIGWVALPVYTAIYLASRPLNGADFGRVLLGFSARTRANAVFLIDEFIRLVVAFFRGQVCVALIDGILYGLGFHFVAGLPYGMLLGITLGLFNIVPYLGTIVCFPGILLFAIFGAHGGSGTAGAVLLAFCAVQAFDLLFITPRVMGQRTGLNPFVIIFSLFFWEAVIGGALGMVLAIPLSAFIVVFWKLLKKEYFDTPVKIDD
ncbi:MAG: AI-2E family transporter [Kiritimatiellaeota bacterium]|nr:AI-2E family transporter [Kiritimatiellota bacterium]